MSGMCVVPSCLCLLLEVYHATKQDIDKLDWGTLDGRIEMEDHCKHRYLASIEGNRYVY